MTGAGSTGKFGSMILILKIVLLIAVLRGASGNRRINWRYVKLSDQDIEENMPFAGHANLTGIHRYKIISLDVQH